MSGITDFEREWYCKLQSLIGGPFDIGFDSEMINYMTGKIQTLSGSFVDHIVYRKPIAQAIKFEDYPIEEYAGKPDPQLVCTKYHRCRREYSQIHQMYQEPGTQVTETQTMTIIRLHCKHTHPPLRCNFLDILEGLELEKGHSVKYITLQFNLGRALKLPVVDNYVKFPFPIYLAYLNYTFVCLQLYNDQDEEVQFGSLNTFLIGGFLPGYNFRRMPPCVIPFTWDGKQYKCGYLNEMVGWMPFKDDTQ